MSKRRSITRVLGVSARLFLSAFTTAHLVIGTTGCGGNRGSSSSQPPVADGGASITWNMKPIAAPATDDCITNVGAGDHTFSCSGLTFLVMVDDLCTRFACGLIFDIHGATMSGWQMRDNTHLQELAPAHGYLVVHPSATASKTGGTWDLTNDPPKVADFMSRMIKDFHVDPDRVHVTGFSQGGAMTWWFLCNHNDLLASAGPVAGALNTKACMSADWTPRVPILNMNGINDQASKIADSRTLLMNVVGVLSLAGGGQIDGDGHWTRNRWEGAGGMLLDSIEHDYGGQPILDGHCIPGGTDVPGGPDNFSLNATTCTTGDIKLNWGPTILQFFLDHPRR